MFSKKFLIIQIVFVATAAVLAFAYLRQPLRILGQVQDFHLTNSDGQTVSLKDLHGKVWVADFFFTTCSGICPMMSAHMGRIHNIFKGHSDIKLVSFSVNPENDSPAALKAYAQKFHADTKQWLFLTGSREDMTRVAVDSFKLGDIREPIFHSSYFVLVDRKGQIRSYYDSGDSKNIDQIIKDLKRLTFPVLPTINASLNGLAGIFLFLGFLAIKRKDQKQHKTFMLCAFFSSALFLCAYVYYHATTHILTRYQGQGILKGIYFFVLGTHTPLAVLIVPFIMMAIRYALKGRFDKHTQITRWLYPTWMYVSVTGVLIYLMLYVFRPA